MEEKQVETKFILPQTLGQEIVNYLTQRPYGEVFRLLEGLKTLEPLDTDNSAADDDEGSAES